MPHARIVRDRFHLVRGANTALDAVRRERQRMARPKRRPKGVNRSGQYVAGARSSTKPVIGSSNSQNA
jgi:transposase